MYRTDDLRAILAAVEAEETKRLREKLERSLIDFVEYFWDIVESHEFSRNWHHGVLCDHLQAISRGEILNVIFNVPPGTSKSTICSVFWPAWEWAQSPRLRWFCVSYSEPLVLRDSNLCKRIIQSDRFRRLWPELAVQRGADEKRKFETTAGGWRLNTTIGGRGTGEHPHRKIIDDPHNVKQSESDVERQAALDYYDGTLATRGMIFNAPVVLVMQRLHEKDLTGHIMSSENYSQFEHVVIPMEYEPRRDYPKSRIPWKDPRKADGELLWPQVFTRAKVDTLKITLGKYKTAGQLQQRPAPDGGGILDVAAVRLWPQDKPLPIFSFILQSYDTAFTDQTQNDPTACSVWGIFAWNDRGTMRAGCMLLDAWQEWLKYPTLRDRAIRDWQTKYGGERKDPANQPRRADKAIIEEKGSGIALIQDMRIANVPIQAFNPGHASKIARAHLASPVLEAGQVWVMESAKEPGKPVKWARDMLYNMEIFPNGEHDDYTDTFSQAMIYFLRTQLLELAAVEEPEPEDHDYYAARKARINPYAS